MGFLSGRVPMLQEHDVPGPGLESPVLGTRHSLTSSYHVFLMLFARPYRGLRDSRCPCRRGPNPHPSIPVAVDSLPA